ncbi:MAG TPA: hypothetical protein VGC42_05450 [Kofleriaceae bacterium]
MDDAPKTDPAGDDTSKLGRFITRYHTFLSSFVIGVAGLIATSIWQYRQSETTEHQAAAQQRVAETSAENSWKITRADILSKNLSTLASTGADTVSQRYGVLLSLTRGEIIDPELAVSYALELGKDNAEDMSSVLASTKHKDYARLARAYGLSCVDRYGLSRTFDVCADKYFERTVAIGKLFADDIDVALAGGAKGPMTLLDHESDVQPQILQYVALYGTALTEMYEHREWDAVKKFQAYSPAAHLVSALVLAASRTGEFVTDDEAKQLDAFHDTQTKWLTDYFAGKTCDADCKGRLLEVMVSHYQEAQGDFDGAMKALLTGPRSSSGMAVSRLHARLLWCQVDDVDLAPLRDRALVPAAQQLLATPNADPATRDAVIGLLAVMTAPTPIDVQASAAWTTLQTEIDKLGPKLSQLLKDRRAAAAKQRSGPPVALSRLDFCNATDAPATDASLDAIPPL